MLVTLTLIALTFYVTPSHSQDTLVITTNFQLTNAINRYAIGPELFFKTDSKTPLNFTNYQKHIDQHVSGKRGDTLEGKILNLGAGNLSHWIGHYKID